MTYEEALSYIHSNFWQGSKPGLERTRELLRRLGDPHKQLRFVHVAGTNGKGSFCAMLSSVLKEAGYKVGCYTSPFVLRFNERMRVNGTDIPDARLAALTAELRPHADSMEDPPTEFELITALAMEYFKQEACDVVVLECGMGGRLDSTNVIETAVLSVITGISLDHTAFLGDSVEKIAAEKAGILKKGTPLLLCTEDLPAAHVIRTKAAEAACPVFCVERESLRVHSFTTDGTVFSCEGYQQVFLPLLGSYQPRNAQNVLRATELLNQVGLFIPREAVYEGIAKTRWPARFERISAEPAIFFDGGHNPEGVDAAVASAKEYFTEKKPLLLTGVMADKDYPYMVSRMAEVAQAAYCIRPDNPRALPAKDYAAAFQAVGIPATACPSCADALRRAIEQAKTERRPILCLGSLYMYSEVVWALREGE